MITHLDECKIDINLIDELNEWAYRELTENGFQNVNHEQALEQFCGFEIRILERKPRKICKSQEFSCPDEYKDKLEILEKAVRTGENLTPYMTKSILDVDYMDEMLNDWGIMHFHLESIADQRDPRFIQRSNYLLLVYIDPDDDGTMYFLQISPHKNMNWSEQDLIRILADNWPTMMEKYRIKGAESITCYISDEEYGKLRKAHINCGVDLHDGRVYVGPYIGVTGKGTTIWTTVTYDMRISDASFMEKLIKQNETLICEGIKNKVSRIEKNYMCSLKQPALRKYIFSIQGTSFFICTMVTKENRFIVAIEDNEERLNKLLRIYG